MVRSGSTDCYALLMGALPAGLPCTHPVFAKGGSHDEGAVAWCQHFLFTSHEGSVVLGLTSLVGPSNLGSIVINHTVQEA